MSHPLARAALGVTAALSLCLPLSAALSLAPAPVRADAVLPLAPLTAPSPYDTPSFGRLVETCALAGLDCSAPGAAPFGVHPVPPSPRALEDARKRQALLAEEWREFLEAYGAQAHLAPVPVPLTPTGPRWPQFVPGHGIGFGESAPGILILPPVLPRGPRPLAAPFPRAPYPGMPFGGPVIPWPAL